MLYYANSLPQVVGGSYQAPDLAFLARCWIESSSKPALVLDQRRSVDLMSTSEDEVRQAARTAFDAGVARLPDEDTILLVDEWQDRRLRASFLFLTHT